MTGCQRYGSSRRARRRCFRSSTRSLCENAKSGRRRTIIGGSPESAHPAAKVISLFPSQSPQSLNRRNQRAPLCLVPTQICIWASSRTSALTCAKFLSRAATRSETIRRSLGTILIVSRRFAAARRPPRGSWLRSSPSQGLGSWGLSTGALVRNDPRRLLGTVSIVRVDLAAAHPASRAARFHIVGSPAAR